MNQDISLASLILAQQLNGGSWGAFSWETIHMLSWIFCFVSKLVFQNGCVSDVRIGVQRCDHALMWSCCGCMFFSH